MRVFPTLSFSVLLLVQKYDGLLALTQSTSSWALRVNNSCLTGQSDCGGTYDHFHACCPPITPCQSQYNSVCCPDQDINCTEALVARGPRCPDPTYNLCDNNGYFCCLPQQFCYSNGNTDGCADAGYELLAGEYSLPNIHQVQPSTAFSASPSTAASSTAATSTNPPAIASSSNTTMTASAKDPPATTSSSSSSSGADVSNRINIGIPIGIGVPSLIVSFYLAWKKWSNSKRK